MAQSPFLDVSSEFQPELTDIQRKQRLAQMLTQQGMQAPQGQVVSGRYVAPSIAQNIANLFSVYSGQNLAKETEARQLALAQKLRQAEMGDIQKFIEAGRPTPEQTVYGAGEEGPTMAVTPEVKPDYARQLAIALGSQSPTVRGLGTEMLKQSMTPQKVGEGEKLVTRDLFGTGGYTPIATGGEKLPTEYKEYQKAQEGGFQGSFFDYQNALKRAGATNVQVSTAKDISAQVGDIAKESRVQATGAVQTADSANRIIQAVDSKNLISGPGANVRLQIAQIADVVGAGGNTTADKISNSRQAVQGLAQLTLQGRKQMRGEGAITESESKLAERAMSGDLSFTAAEIRQLAEAAKRAAKFTYNQHQNIINTMQSNPDAKGLVPYFQVPADADIFNPRPVGNQSPIRNKADQIIKGNP
jgi:hypothetical protein